MSRLFRSTDYGATYTQVPFTKLQTGNTSTYEFTSMNGKKILWQQFAEAAGISLLTISLPPAMAKGMYTLQIHGKQLNSTIKLLY